MAIRSFVSLARRPSIYLSLASNSAWTSEQLKSDGGASAGGSGDGDGGGEGGGGGGGEGGEEDGGGSHLAICASTGTFVALMPGEVL